MILGNSGRGLGEPDKEGKESDIGCGNRLVTIMGDCCQLPLGNSGREERACLCFQALREKEDRRFN